ncbi:MAG: PQQ-binding-like beta-propeller repeat protein, partial [Thermoguttaceae bacterium]
TGSVLFMEFGGVAANTPVSDGKNIVVMYSSNDVACFDLDGNLRWTRGLGYENPRLRIDTGMSSSPLIIGKYVIVQCVSQGEAFIAALNISNGEKIWRTELKKEQIWSSPVILKHSDDSPCYPKESLLVVSRDKLFLVDIIDGRITSKYNAECNTIASPVGVDGDVYLQANAIHKIPVYFYCGPGFAEKVTRWPMSDSAPPKYDVLSWVEPKLRADNPSPVIADGKIYCLKAPGILMCASTEDGEMLWQLRLEGPFWATPIIVGDLLVAVNHAGLVQVVDLSGEKGKIVATAQIEPKILATPAAEEDAVYLRSDEAVWKLQ